MKIFFLNFIIFIRKQKERKVFFPKPRLSYQIRMEFQEIILLHLLDISQCKIIFVYEFLIFLYYCYALWDVINEFYYQYCCIVLEIRFNRDIMIEILFNAADIELNDNAHFLL